MSTSSDSNAGGALLSIRDLSTEVRLLTKDLEEELAELEQAAAQEMLSEAQSSRLETINATLAVACEPLRVVPCTAP